MLGFATPPLNWMRSCSFSTFFLIRAHRCSSSSCYWFPPFWDRGWVVQTKGTNFKVVGIHRLICTLGGPKISRWRRAGARRESTRGLGNFLLLPASPPSCLEQLQGSCLFRNDIILGRQLPHSLDLLNDAVTDQLNSSTVLVEICYVSLDTVLTCYFNASWMSGSDCKQSSSGSHSLCMCLVS